MQVLLSVEKMETLGMFKCLGTSEGQVVFEAEIDAGTSRRESPTLVRGVFICGLFQAPDFLGLAAKALLLKEAGKLADTFYVEDQEPITSKLLTFDNDPPKIIENWESYV